MLEKQCSKYMVQIKDKKKICLKKLLELII